MKKRGFTLIELLAVIVILAIIALIATPIVMNVIENSKKGAAERSAANIEHAAELFYYNGNSAATRFICKNGVCNNGTTTLELTGKGPEDGIVNIDNQGNITLNSIVINGHICYKNGESYTCDKATKTNDSTTNGVLTLNESKTTILSNYIIKGNSIQKNNIFDNILYAGKGYTSTGILDISSARVSTNKIDVTNYNSVTVTYNDINNSPFLYVLFDESDNLIAREINKKSGSIIDTSNASSIGLTFYNTTATLKESDFSYIVIEQINPTPEAPIEIQSAGDLVTEEGPNKGKYNIPVTVSGKNIADPKQIESFVEGIQSVANGKDTKIITDENGRQILQMFSGSGFLGSTQVENYNEIRKIFSGIFKENTQYTISFDYYRNVDSKSMNVRIRYTDESTVPLENKPGAVSNTVYSFKYTSETNKTIESIDLNYNAGYTYIYLDTLQIEEGTGATSYEPYVEPKTHNIYLDEPLRCVGDVCDYIDYSKGKVLRYIEVVDDSGTKPINESFKVLTTPIEQTKSLPTININKGVSNIFIETSIKPSEFIVDYYK